MGGTVPDDLSRDRERPHRHESRRLTPSPFAAGERRSSPLEELRAY